MQHLFTQLRRHIPANAALGGPSKLAAGKQGDSSARVRVVFVAVQISVFAGQLLANFVLVDAEQPAERAARTDRSLVTRPGGERVLIMDDEPSMLVLAQRMLEYLGCRVEVAHPGHDAIELHARARDRGDPFGLMILDLTIPGGMGGRETASRLRALDPEVRLVASSGYSNAPVMADHVGHGFCGILPKPYDLQQLAKVLSSVLDGVPEPPPRSSDHERSPTEPPSTE